MFENVIVDQNPHWDGKYYEEGVKRDVLDVLKSTLNYRTLFLLLESDVEGKAPPQAINKLSP